MLVLHVRHGRRALSAEDPPRSRSRMACLAILSACMFSIVATCMPSAALASRTRTSTVSGSSADPPFVLACPSAKLCLAGDSTGDILQWQMSTGTVTASSPQSVDHGNTIAGLACPIVSLCIAVDSGGNVLTSTDPSTANPSWQVSHVASSPFTDLACPTAALCVASAGGDIATSSSPSGGGSTWSLASIDSGQTYECFHYNLAGEPGCQAALGAVACATAGSCVAVDDAGHFFWSSDPGGGADAWNGSSAGSIPESEAYNDITCPSESLCLLTDSYGGDVASWRVGTDTPPTIAAHLFAIQAGGITCQSDSVCLTYGDSASMFDTNTSALSASSWSSVGLPTDGSPITAASCPTSGANCFAISNAGQLLEISPPASEASSARTRRGQKEGSKSKLRARLVGRARVRARRGAEPWHWVLRGPDHFTIGAKRGPHNTQVTIEHEPPSVARLGSRTLAHESELRVLDKRGRLWPKSNPTAVAAATPSLSYGIADAQSACASWYVDANDERCSLGTSGFASYYQNGFNYFTLLKNALPLGYVRFFVPYDAVEYYDTKTQACAFSPALTSAANGYKSRQIAGQEWWTLFNEIQDAEAIGLTPVISLVSSTGVPAPAGTQSGSSTGGIPQYPLVNTYQTDADDYECGVEGLLAGTSANNVPVKYWEAWNEPDSVCQYNGDSSSHEQSCNQTGAECSGTSGGDQAAGLYLNFYLTDTFVEDRSDTVIAGVFSDPSSGYFEDYACYVNKTLYLPPVWSYHDYGDVGSYAKVSTVPLAQAFDVTLQSFCYASEFCASQPHVWVTEAATDLKSISTTFSDGSSTSSCDDGQQTGTLGDCINGSTTYQKAGGQGFLNLASQGSAFSGQIANVFWYELEADNASSGADSGLLSPAAPWSGEPQCPQGQYDPPCYYTSPDGDYAVPRESYCVLTDGDVSGCGTSGDPSEDAKAWSVQPGPS